MIACKPSFFPIAEGSYPAEDKPRSCRQDCAQALLRVVVTTADNRRQRGKRENVEIKEFAERVCDAVGKELGTEYQVEYKEVRKNNGVILHGMLIMFGEKNVVPTIYLDTFWEEYESGESWKKIIRRLVSIYRRDAPKGKIDMDFFRSFEEVKPRICYRLIGRKGNEELLSDVPYIEFLDLAVCFYYAYHGDMLGEGTILVHNSHQNLWETSTAELLRLAQDNTPRLFPWECHSLSVILREIMGEEFDSKEEFREEDFSQDDSMLVLSNDRRLQGAICMLYPGVLEEIACRWEKSIYVLPSSVHEVILLPDVGRGGAKALKEMIVQVNNTQVAPEEVLSDSLYYYDFHEKRVKIIF